jgi:hypothetical protein
VIMVRDSDRASCGFARTSLDSGLSLGYGF